MSVMSDSVNKPELDSAKAEVFAERFEVGDVMVDREEGDVRG
jgi:hypothetical protein